MQQVLNTNATHGTFTKINHILGCKGSLNKLQRSKITKRYLKIHECLEIKHHMYK